MDRPLFIVGNDRSGTTMLRLILDAGPEIAIPPESMILTDYGAVLQAGELGDHAVGSALHGRGVAPPQDRAVETRTGLPPRSRPAWTTRTRTGS